MSVSKFYGERMMKTNEANIDRIARIVVGLGLVVLGFMTQGLLGTGISVLGLIPIVTGVVGWCPLYSLLGISTCPVKK
ncbi:YgaP family membrane protein [Leptospira ainazelensis]|uniref:YgaP family membrane protein n=1 Tax=Leptospira ainazelensis TaxID=2810034 RepID=UPI002FC8B420